MKTKEQKLKEAMDDLEKARADYRKAIADLEKANDKIKELEKQ